MQKLKASVAFLTLLSFVSGGVPTLQWVETAEAQTGLSVVPMTVPNYAPASLTSLSFAGASLTAQMNQCDQNAMMAQAAAAAKNGKNLPIPKPSPHSTDKKSGPAACTSTDTSKYTCDTVCSPPTSTDFDRDQFCTSLDHRHGASTDEDSTTVTTYAFLPGEKDELKSDSDLINAYVAYLNYKSTQCSQSEFDDVKTKVAAYECKMNLLSSAESQAATQLQQALDLNNQNFTKMMQFQDQVKTQMGQMGQILGLDSSGKPTGGGLIGTQQALKAGLEKWDAEKATATSAVQSLQKRTLENEQTLVAQEMTQVENCMQGESDFASSSGGSQLCNKQVMTTDANGKSVGVTNPDGSPKMAKQSCGALEALRDELTGQAFKTGLNGSFERNGSTQVGADFDSLMKDIYRDMGADDTATADGSLVGRVTDWSTIVKKYQAQISNIQSESGVGNFGAQLTQVANSCYSQGTSWKTQQQRSAASPYNTAKSKITEDTNTLTGQLTTGLSDMNELYGTAMGLLTNGAAVSLDRSQCTTTDPAKMTACYSTIDQRMHDIQDGTGTVGVTTMAINGGNLRPGFSVSCQGIQKCVTTIQNDFTQSQNLLASAATATQNAVNTANATIKNQLTAFASGLGGIQQGLQKQFSDISNSLSALGVHTSAKLTPLQGESLQQTPGPPPGPYQDPNNMAAVLSKLVPGGLPDPSQDGMSQLLQDAQDKEEKDQEKIAADLSTYQKALSKINSIQTACNQTGDPSTRVANDAQDLQKTCLNALPACSTSATQGAVGSLMQSLSTYSATTDSSSITTNLNTLSYSATCNPASCYQFIAGNPKNNDPTQQAATTGSGPGGQTATSCASPPCS